MSEVLERISRSSSERWERNSLRHCACLSANLNNVLQLRSTTVNGTCTLNHYKIAYLECRSIFAEEQYTSRCILDVSVLVVDIGNDASSVGLLVLSHSNNFSQRRDILNPLSIELVALNLGLRSNLQDLLTSKLCVRIPAIECEACLIRSIQRKLSCNLCRVSKAVFPNLLISINSAYTACCEVSGLRPAFTLSVDEECANSITPSSTGTGLRKSRSAVSSLSSVNRCNVSLQPAPLFSIGKCLLRSSKSDADTRVTQFLRHSEVLFQCMRSSLALSIEHKVSKHV